MPPDPGSGPAGWQKCFWVRELMICDCLSLYKVPRGDLPPEIAKFITDWAF